MVVQISLLRTRSMGLLLAVALFSLVSGCNKSEITLAPDSQAIQFLVGTGNRMWFIKEIYVNDVRQTLTASQSKFWKSYMVSLGDPDSSNGTFADSDGNKGAWELKSATSLSETIQNNQSPTPIFTILSINKLNANTMDVQYFVNGTQVRMVYYAN